MFVDQCVFSAHRTCDNLLVFCTRRKVEEPSGFDDIVRRWASSEGFACPTHLPDLESELALDSVDAGK